MPLARQEKKIRQERIIKLTSVMSLIFFALVIVLTVENMLLSCILAFVTHFLLSPFVNWLESSGLSRKVSTLSIFITTAILFSLGINLLLPSITAQAASFQAELPKYIDGTAQLFESTENYINLIFHSYYTINISQNIESFLMSWTTALFEDLPTILSKSVTTTFLTPFLAYFMLQDGHKWLNRVFNMIPNVYFELALNLQHQLTEKIGDFIRARLLEALIVGGCVWLGLLIIGFPYAPLLGFFAFLTNLIPYIGPVIGAVPALIIALINGSGGLDILLVTTIYLIAQLIDIIFIIPLVVAKIVNLHPVIVVVAIIIGAQVLGILGMVISIPVACAVQVIFSVIYEHLVEFRA